MGFIFLTICKEVNKIEVDFTKCKVEFKTGDEGMVQLKKLREGKNLTLSQVAEECGISECYVSQIENGNRRPSIEVAFKLSKVYGIKWHEIYENKEK